MAQRELSILVDLKDNASEEIEGLGDKTESLKKPFRQMAMVGTASFLAIASSVTKALETFGKFEQAEVAFESMLGSTDEAVTMMEELQSYSAETPFRFRDIASATRTLVSFGSEAEEARDQIKFLGDIASGAQVPLEDMSAIFGKVQTRGKAMTREINQMARRGIPIIDKLAEQFDVSKEEIFEMAENSELTADVVEDALRSMTEEGGMFEDQTAEQADTIIGKWSTLKDNFELTVSAFGDIFDEDAKEIMDGLIELTGSIESFVAENQTIVKWATITAGALSLVVAGLGAIGLIGLAVTSGLSTLASVFGGLATAASVVAGAIGLIATPVWVVIGAIGALIGIGYLLYKNWETIADGARALGKTIKEIFKGVWDFFVDFVSSILDLYFGMIDKVLGFAEKIPGVGGLADKMRDVVPVNDALIKSDGEVVKFHPEDDILAMKDFEKLQGQGKGGTVINVNLGKGNYFLDRNAGRRIAKALRDDLGRDNKIS